MDDLMPDPPLQDELPEELPWLLRLLPRADVYLQDEVEVALRPTLTRVSCRKGWRGQRLVEAPGNNAKQYGFGLVDWRDGWFDWRRAPKRSAPPVCAQLRRAVERSQARGRIALVLLVTWAPTRPRARCGCASCWTNCAVNWCWSTPPPMVPKPIVSSGSGERSAAPSRMRIPARPSHRWWRMPMPGRTPFPPPRSSARSAAPSPMPIPSMTMNSAVPPENLGSTLRYRAPSPRCLPPAALPPSNEVTDVLVVGVAGT